MTLSQAIAKHNPNADPALLLRTTGLLMETMLAPLRVQALDWPSKS